MAFSRGAMRKDLALLETRSPLEPHWQMFHSNFVRLRLGQRSPSGAPISTDTYMRIPSAPLLYLSTHTPANSETDPGLQLSSAHVCSRTSIYGQLAPLARKMARRHHSDSEEFCTLGDSQVNLPLVVVGRGHAVQTSSDLG